VVAGVAGAVRLPVGSDRLPTDLPVEHELPDLALGDVQSHGAAKVRKRSQRRSIGFILRLAVLGEGGPDGVAVAISHDAPVALALEHSPGDVQRQGLLVGPRLDTKLKLMP